MKKTIITALTLAVLGTIFIAGNALAVPFADGEYELVSGNFEGAPSYTAGTNLRYFIWTDDNSTRTDWHIRWSGDANVNAGADYLFTGTIQLTDNSFDVTTFSFDSNDSWYGNYGNTAGTYTAFANIGQDGLDLSIIGTASPSYIGFNLSILPLTAAANNSYPGGSQVADFTFLGSTNFHPSSEDWAVAAPVPEPATILLLGTGLIGLVGISRRRMKKA